LILFSSRVVVRDGLFRSRRQCPVGCRQWQQWCRWQYCHLRRRKQWFGLWWWSRCRWCWRLRWQGTSL
jgi:hypothetical protein